MHATENLDEIRMEVNDASFICCFFAHFAHRFCDFLLCFFNKFFDTYGLDTTVRDEVFKRCLCNLATNRIKRRKDNHAWRFVDEYVNTGRAFKCTYVAAFFANNLAFYVVVWQCNGRSENIAHDRIGT